MKLLKSPAKAVIAGVTVSVLALTSASAACLQADAAGTWRVFVNSHASGGAQTLDWQRCTMRVRTNGRLRTTSFCIGSDGTQTSILSGSRFILKSNCRLRGTIELEGGVTETIVDGQLSIDKATMAGVATDPGGPSTFVAIKQ